MNQHSNSHEHRFRQHLHEQLLTLSALGFEQLIAHLLVELGYNPVEIKRRPTLGRHSRRGRNTHGGVDLLAYRTTELTSASTAVQVKQYRRPVARHFVDSLRGAVLRTKAHEGLLITTSSFSRIARQAAGSSDQIAPIRLVSGEELVSLLIAHQVGVRHQPSGCFQLDHYFFGSLEARRGPTPQHACREPGPHDGASPGAANTIPTQHELATNQRKEDMTWSTHVMAGLNTLWLLQSVPGGITQDTIGSVVAGAAFGALLPDLDAAESKIKHLRVIGIKPFAPVAVVLYQGLGHRGLLHSLLGLSLLAIFSLLFIPWWGWQTSAALVLGYASHLGADACTKSGIPLLYPSKQRYHLLPRGWRFTTGSQAEEVLFVILAAAVLLWLLGLLFPFPAISNP